MAPRSNESGPTLTFRAATLADVAAITQAEQRIAQTPGLLASRPHELSETRTAAKVAELSSGRGCFLVAETQGQLVAHGVLEPLGLEVIRHVVQLTLAVHPGWQGQGVGSALLERLIEWARAAPAVEKIELRVRHTNTRALALYARLGFVEEGRFARRLKLPDGRYLDDVAMGLFVKP